jgi:hypothetical protein
VLLLGIRLAGPMWVSHRSTRKHYQHWQRERFIDPEALVAAKGICLIKAPHPYYCQSRVQQLRRR